MHDDSTHDPGLVDVDLTDIEATLRTLDADDLTLLEPPSSIWDGIAVQLEDGHPGANDRPEQSASAATITSIDSRRRWAPQQRLLLAAAAAVLIVAGAVAIGLRSDGDTTVVATAELAYDPVAFDELGADASARAELLEADDGYAIELTDESLPTDIGEPADLELWLIALDDEGGVADLVSLGLIDDPDQAFAVPAGYDPARFSVVDISVEPRDGDQQHSGRSILRGSLSA